MASSLRQRVITLPLNLRQLRVLGLQLLSEVLRTRARPRSTDSSRFFLADICRDPLHQSVQGVGLLDGGVTRLELGNSRPESVFRIRIEI